MRRHHKFLLFLAYLLIGVVLYFGFELNQPGRSAQFLTQISDSRDWVRAHFWSSLVLATIVYVALTGLSFPLTTVLSLIAGFYFGAFWGSVASLIGSLGGALLAFLIARYLARDYVASHFTSALARIDRGIERKGEFYLLAIRLFPLSPFVIINLVFGLTDMRAWRYLIHTAIGHSPYVIAFAYLGANFETQLGDIRASGYFLVALSLLSIAVFGWTYLKRGRA